MMLLVLLHCFFPFFRTLFSQPVESWPLGNCYACRSAMTVVNCKWQKIVDETDLQKEPFNCSLYYKSLYFFECIIMVLWCFGKCFCCFLVFYIFYIFYILYIFFRPSMLSHFYLPLRSMAAWIVDWMRFHLEYAGLHVCSQRVATSMKGVESLKAFAIYETFPYWRTIALQHFTMTHFGDVAQDLCVLRLSCSSFWSWGPEHW